MANLCLGETMETLMEDIYGWSEVDKGADGFIAAFQNSVTTTNNYQAIKLRPQGDAC